MIDELKEALYAALLKDRAHIAEKLAMGGASDYADYRARVGAYKQIARDMATIDETVRGFIHDEND